MAQQPRQQRIGIYGKFTPTALDTSESNKMRALAGLGQTIADTSLSIANPMVTAERAEQGIEAAEQARTVDPVTGEVSYGEVEKMAAYKVGAAQYNANLMKGYQASISNDARQNLTRISVESEGNLDTFDAGVKGYFKGMKGVGNLPPEVRLGIDGIVGAYRDNIIAEQTSQAVKVANDEEIRANETAVSDAIRFTANGNVSAAAISRQQVVDYQNSQVLAGKIGEKGAEELVRVFDVQLATASNRRQVDVIYEEQGYVSAISYVQNIQDNRDPSMNPVEHENLVTQLTTDLSNKDSLESARQSEMSSARKIMQAGNTSNLFVGVLKGTTDINDIIVEAQQGNISETQLATLENQISSAGQGVDDPDVVSQITELMLTDPDKAQANIEEFSGSLKLSSKTALELTTQIRENKDKGGIMQSEKVKHFSKHLANNTKSVGMYGFVDPIEQARESELQTVYRSRVLAGEPPAVVARELISANKAASSPPSYASGYKSYDDATAPGSAWDTAEISNEAAIIAADNLYKHYQALELFDVFELDYSRVMESK